MIDLIKIQAECIEILKGIPKFRHEFRTKDRVDTTPLKPAEILEHLSLLNFEYRNEIDQLVQRLVLDRNILEEGSIIWYLIEHRLRAAIHYLQMLDMTTRGESQIVLTIDDLDYGIEWALNGLWMIAGPVWSQRASILIANGEELSYEGSTRDLF